MGFVGYMDAQIIRATTVREWTSLGTLTSFETFVGVVSSVDACQWHPDVQGEGTGKLEDSLVRGTRESTRKGWNVNP